VSISILYLRTIISLTGFSIRDSATRFQLPKISPLDFGPHESALTEEELSNEELESDNRSDTARDSSSLISDLLGHLEEEAALFPGPTLQATFTSSSSRSVFYSVGEETEFDTETDGLSGESGHFPLTPVDSPPLEVDVPGCTLSQSYQELVQNIPLDTTSETVLTRNDSLDRQSVDSFTFDAGLEVDLPITPKRKQRKNNPATSVLSPSFLGPFPTPFSHRQFIASSPSGSLRSPSASSVRDPTSLSPTARPSLKRRDTTRPRLHLSDIFKNRQASNKL
jgi:hypothetical protein